MVTAQESETLLSSIFEYGTWEQPKRRASFERNFISLACKFTSL